MDLIKDSLFNIILSRSHTVKTMKEVDPNLDFDALVQIQPNLVHYINFLCAGIKNPACDWFDDDIFYIEEYLLPLQPLEKYEICDIRKLIKNKYISIKDYNIFKLAKENKHHTLKALLPFFENLDKKDKFEMTALSYACDYDCEESVQLLVEAGCDVDMKVSGGKTPLHFVSQNHNKKLIKFLIDRGCDVNKQDKYKNNALIFALRMKNENMTWECGDPFIHRKNQEKIKKCLVLLINAGCNFNLHKALHYACKHDFDECAKLFIDRGCDIEGGFDFEEESEWTPFITACQNNSPKCIKLLIEKGCNIDQKDHYGRTGLHYTCYYWDPTENTKFLINAGCKVNEQTDSGKTPLFYACKINCEERVKLLIEAGCDVNKQMVNGMTALHKCCKHERKECAKLLIEAGCDMYIKDNNGKTAFDYTKTSDCQNLLIQTGYSEPKNNWNFPIGKTYC